MTIRVSAVIPTSNRQTLVRRAVGSVLAQTVPPHEVIVVDDGSQPPVAEQLRDLPAFVQFIRNEEPTGPAAARNLGVRHASGDFIAFLDDDDTWVPWKLEEVQHCLSEHPEVSIVLHRTGHKPTPPGQAGSCSLVVEPLKRMLYQQPPSPDGVVVRRSLHLESPFDESFAGAEDLDYLIRIAKAGARIAEIPETLAILGEAPATAIGIDKRIQGRIELLKYHPQILADRRARAFFYLRLGHQYRRNQQRNRAVTSFGRSFVAKPTLMAVRGTLLTLLPSKTQQWFTRTQ